MDDLTLVGVHEDGEHLVLMAADGQHFRLLVDEALRAAVRRDRPRLGQIQAESDGRLPPREIQARIRAGRTAEEIASSAGVPLEQIRRYEGPVLAEREFVAQQARGVRVRRVGASTAGPSTLGDLVAQRLGQRARHENAPEWDAWREDGGGWIVRLSFQEAGSTQTAEWSYDPQLRHVSPRDDLARQLGEPDGGTSTAHRRPATPYADRSGRTEAGSNTAPADARSGAEPSGDALPRAARVEQGAAPATNGYLEPALIDPSLLDPAWAAGSDPEPKASDHAATVELLDSLRERRGRRQRPFDLDEELNPTNPDRLDAAIDSFLSQSHGEGEEDGNFFGPLGVRPSPSRPMQPEAPMVPTRPELVRRPAPVQRYEDTPFEPTESSSATRRSSWQRGQDAEVIVLPDDTGSTRLRPAPPVTTPAGSSTSPSSPSAAAANGAAGHGPAAKRGPTTPASRAGAPPDQDPEPTPPAPDKPSARRNRRSSVPSWDDIVFGAKRD